ncbi:MAG TPA: hypothetical protein VHO23_00820 [Candidatus Paceibacterota bacterium]|nr:hypothetical protein [Candidatus Paceibacterota bacterium]
MNLFSLKKKGHAVALIDIGSASIGVAYAFVEEGKPPAIYYTARLPIDVRDGETIGADMLRTLERITHKLVREGAKELHAALGSAHIHTVLVSIAAPWQETGVRIESIRKDKPFAFTRAILEEATRRNDNLPEGRIESGESVIATILNGYETGSPFGKKVTRADLVILSSTVDRELSEAVERTVRKEFHTHDVRVTAFAPVAFELLRDLYPLQKDFLVLDVSGTATDLAFVKNGLLADVQSIRCGVHALIEAGRAGGMVPAGLPGSDAAPAGLIDTERNPEFAARMSFAERLWLDSLKSSLTKFSERHALPRTLFLLADDDVRGFLEKILNTDILRSLWLSDEPLAVVPVRSEQLASVVATRGSATGDIFLAMLALFYSRRAQH